MKKTLIFCLAALMLFTGIMPMLAAATAPTLSLSSAEAEPGQEVELTLSISGNTGIAGLAVSLDYDKTTLGIKSCTDGKLFSSFTAGKNYIFDDSADVKTNGTLAKFVFTVADTAANGEYEIRILVRSCTNAALNDVTCATVSGKIKVCGHKNKTTLPAVPAACTKAGLTAGVRCADCGKTITAQKEIKALGHNYVKTVTAPTCTAGGFTSYNCSRCNASYTDAKKEALGHSWNKGEITVAPTTSAAGSKTYTCERCGAKKTETVPSLPPEEKPAFLLGDVDLDGKVSSADARLTLRGAVGLTDENIDLINRTSTHFLAADVDANGKIAADDARMILRASVGLEQFA